ncbi:MAG: TatD family hydrolase [Alphaproteobacteria bacterium]|nr:TatD family hydrolase [Alphaproteobacteria bacterium]MBU1548788.1 TatD family hydrolase [Alphaproteobacteria bacterium]MBU2335614.1 TatD family hydrolase [Alphaproteobacteria bacterium]MBU2390991.1 TatD family hydrolase [Alphaproteobacteria bacterium]
MIDFHCHIDLFPDPEHAIDVINRSGHYVLSVTTTPKAFAKTAHLARKSRRIRTALGLHPQIAHERLSELPLFDRLIGETEYVGEVGLDGGEEYRPHYDKQLIAFKHVLKTCEAVGGRVLSIHSRHAASDVLELLHAHPDAGTPVLHWFSGSQAELQRAVKAGCWFSVGGPMVKSRAGLKRIAAMPRDRVLTETDAPFAASPQSALGTELQMTTTRLSETWSCSYQDAAEQLKQNLRQVGSQCCRGGQAFIENE